jgi:hypothetical protein
MSFKRVLTGESGIAHAVEQQMRNWELGREQRPRRATAERPQVEDFVCISRMVGLEVREVVSRLAERLRWPFFDRELLSLMAGDDEIRQRLYQTLDHRDLTWWEAIASPFLVGHYVVDDFFHRLCDTVLTLARQSSAIFVGRGIDLILPADHGLRVWLVASVPTRLESLRRRYQLTAAEARQVLELQEAERREFFRRHFHLEPSDPARFDLTLNLDRLDPDAAADLILATRARLSTSRATAGTVASAAGQQA